MLLYLLNFIFWFDNQVKLKLRGRNKLSSISMVCFFVNLLKVKRVYITFTESAKFIKNVLLFHKVFFLL